MAKNIDFMGATFPDVPSIRLPQHEGGLVSFDDTTDATATADKILQGYTAYANGQKLTGTASGGITPSGTISITQNGQVDVTQYATADVNVSGGGASNFVHGEFNTGTTKNTNILVNVPYTGNGYPIAGVFVIKGGIYNNSAGGNTDWYNLVQRFAIGRWSFVKSRMNTVPTYAPYQYDDPNMPDNQATVSATYKNSTSSATNYADGGSVATYLYTPENASDSRDSAIKFKSNTQFQIHVAKAGGYGFLDNTDYEYFIVYSS